MKKTNSFSSSLGSLESSIQTENDKVSRNHFDLFPNLGISFDDKKKKNSVVSASYRRRITRSDYQDLNLSESRESELSAWKSNPFLKPNYIDNYQVSYSFKRMFVILNNYSVTHDFFCDYIRDFAEKEKCFNPAKPEKSYQ